MNMKKVLTLFSALLLFGSMIVVQAADYYYRGTQNSWGTTLMTTSTDGYYAYFSAQGYETSESNNNFKISTSTDSWDYNSSYVTRGFNGTDIKNSEGNKSIGLNWDGDNVCIYCTSDFYVLIYFPNTAINTTSNPIICASTTLPDNSTPPTIKLHGNFSGDWATTDAFILAGNEETASLTLTDVAKGNYQFGVRIGSDDNWTSNGSAFNRANPSHAIASGSGNCTFNADVAGNYTFTWTYDDNSLSITYPALPTYTVDFVDLASIYFVNDEVTFNATSTGVDNPTYTYYVKKGDAAYGSAVTSYTFAETGSYTVKVEVRENGAGDALKTEEQTVTIDEPLTLYFVNKDAWENVKIYFYNPGKSDWPGDAMTATGDHTAFHNYAVYSYTVHASVFSAANVIFNNGSGSQTGDLDVETNHYYYDGAWYATLAECDPLPVVKMGGKFFSDTWAYTENFAVDASGDFASITLNAVPKGNHEFKVILEGSDWRSTGGTFTRADYSAVISGNNDDNMTLTADIAGNYTFKWTYTSNTLEITYPDLPAQSVSFDGLNAEILKGAEVNFAATSTGITNPAYTFFVKPAGGEYGSAVSSYTFDAVGNYVVKVSAEGDNTIDPVVEEENVVVYDTYTFNAGTRIYVDFTAMIEGDKGVNYPNNDAASLAYDEEGAGTFKTIQFTNNVTWSTLNTFIKTAKGSWAELKFTVPADGQNMIIVAADGASYTWGTYVDLTTDFYLAASFNDWSMTDNRFMKATEDADEASITINITEYSNITFKVIDNGEWRGCNPAKTITKDDNNVTILADAEGNNVAMTPYAAGDYIFTLKLDGSRLLTVTYPDGEAMPIPTNIYLACDELNNWAAADPAYKFSVSGDIATLDVTLTEETNYAFKLVYNDAWMGANYNFKYYWCTDVPMIVDETQANLYSFKAGTYTFTYNLTSGQLSIAYPATVATNVTISEYEYATLYSATAFDVPNEVEAYVISEINGIKLAMDRIYRIPANTGVLLYAPEGTYPFYEGDGRWMDAPASNLLKGSTADQVIDNALVHYVLSYDTDYNVGFYWPYGTGDAQGVGAFTNNAGKAYLEIPANSQPAGVVARRGFPFNPANAPTGLDEVESQGNAQKLIRDGQLFILRDGRIFNAQGVRVQ